MTVRWLAVWLIAAVAVPVAVAVWIGAEGAAVFGAGWLVAGLVATAALAVVGRSVRDRDHGDAVRRAACERALTVVVPAVVVVLVGSPWILWAFGRQIRDTGVGTLALLSLAVVPLAVVAVVARSAAVRGSARGALVPPAVALGIALAGGRLLSPIVGVIGVAFAWFTGFALVAAVAVLHSRSLITRPGDCGAVTAGRGPR